eukprot:CAMPEP_0119043926 /NCGR_PEP_ID=MMETSP1177-20130426/27025_1 /TAXON_ID=2985 /ORGANISM="Ochromonas sp, Strain CCMP1899" /LENGTH=267 /DNA_ID=CAMNT_0007013081 /DNA_START=63 /DNA_END=866 /DNA_ORIENTATION=-
MTQAVRKRSFKGDLIITKEESDENLSPIEDDNNQSQISGKWTEEEETVANQLVIDFETGSLIDCDEGCTLRSYLARKLNCAPMRISKKFAGRCIGKLPFVRRSSHMTSLEITNIIPVLRRPRNINHRPRKIRQHITVASDSDDGSHDLASDRSSPISRSESSSNSSSDYETDIGPYNQNANKINNNKSATNFACLNSSSSCKKPASDGKFLGILPSLFLDDFEHTFEDDNPYDAVFLTSHEDNHNHVIGDDWHDVLSFFCNNEDSKS